MNLPADGHENCLRVAMGSAQGGCGHTDQGAQLNGLTPWPAGEPHRVAAGLADGARCSSPSTVAPASVLGLSSSNPDGCEGSS